jgi:hypothetical protein
VVADSKALTELFGAIWKREMPRITNRFFKSLIILSLAVALPRSMWGAQRTTISLNGTWDIEDSREAEAVPVVWNHKAPVPGLAHSVQPAFPQVNLFDSRMLIQIRVGDGKGSGNASL